jgi:hypothetical protein
MGQCKYDPIGLGKASASTGIPLAMKPFNNIVYDMTLHSIYYTHCRAQSVYVSRASQMIILPRKVYRKATIAE